jgi:serine/threonine protein kinase
LFNSIKGAHSVVYHAVSEKSGESVAIKLINNTEVFRKMSMERSILEGLVGKSNHVVQAIDFIEHEHFVIFVFELLDKSLRQILTNIVHLKSIKIVRHIAENVLTALSSLHQSKVIHGDLKLENIMLSYCQGQDVHPVVKLIDLGSAFYEHGQLSSYFQSRRYRSPDVYVSGKRRRCTSAVDMWSFGCVLFELYSGTPLFIAKTSKYLISVSM